jgi:hypothetical protein
VVTLPFSAEASLTEEHPAEKREAASKGSISIPALSDLLTKVNCIFILMCPDLLSGKYLTQFTICTTEIKVARNCFVN